MAQLGRVGAERLIADDEPSPARIAESGPDDLVDVQHGLRSEATAIAAAVIEQGLVQRVEVTGPEAMQLVLSERRDDVGVDLALVASEGARPEARVSGRKP
jgi:hypothetical protein